jgi:hypothetical protein
MTTGLMPEKELEIELGAEHAVNPVLLESPSGAKLGGERPTGASPSVNVSAGRSHLVRNLRSVYKRSGRAIPEDVEIFWRHEIWIIQHTVRIEAGGSPGEVEQFCCELRFPSRTTVLDVMPDARYIRQEAGAFRCYADVLLNGRVAALQAGAKAVGREQYPIVEQVSMPVNTPYVQAVGIGDAVVQFVFTNHHASLAGEQTLVETILTEKHTEELPWAIRMHAVISGREGLPVRLRSSWVPMFTRLVTDLE